MAVNLKPGCRWAKHPEEKYAKSRYKKVTNYHLADQVVITRRFGHTHGGEYVTFLCGNSSPCADLFEQPPEGRMCPKCKEKDRK